MSPTSRNPVYYCVPSVLCPHWWGRTNRYSSSPCGVRGSDPPSIYIFRYRFGSRETTGCSRKAYEFAPKSSVVLRLLALPQQTNMISTPGIIRHPRHPDSVGVQCILGPCPLGRIVGIKTFVSVCATDPPILTPYQTSPPPDCQPFDSQGLQRVQRGLVTERTIARVRSWAEGTANLETSWKHPTANLYT